MLSNPDVRAPYRVLVRRTMPPGFLLGELPSDHGCAHEAAETDERAVWYDETEVPVLPEQTDDESHGPTLAEQSISRA